MDITDIVLAVIGLVFAVLSAFLIPFIKSKASAAEFDDLGKWVRVAVEAAEMLYKGVGRGREKKDYVLDFLYNKGLYVDGESVDNLIESAVLELKNGIK